MKTYLLNIIPKLSQFGEKLDNTALLTSKHWVVIDDETSACVTYIFRSNGGLLISQLGKVLKAKWEYLGSQSILIEIGEESFLFKHGFFNEDLLALKVDGREEYAVLVNEHEYEGGVKSSSDVQRLLESIYGREQEQTKVLQLKKAEGYLDNKVIAPKKSELTAFLQYFLLPLIFGLPAVAFIAYLIW